jgi:hypothetical protein
MHIEDKHDPSADEVVAIERRLYEHNCQATGFSDGKDLRFVARDKVGNIIGAALGYSWGGISENSCGSPNQPAGVGWAAHWELQLLRASPRLAQSYVSQLTQRDANAIYKERRRRA